MANRRRRSKKWVSWLIFLVLAVVAVVICVLVWNSYFKPKDDSPKPAEQSKAEEKRDEQKPEEKKEQTDAQPEEKKKVEQYDGEDPNKATGITGAITYAGVSGDNLMIRVNIDQYLNSGTCTLSLRQGGGNAYSTTANVIDSASTSTCEGFNVPTAGFPAGIYNIYIYIESGDKTGEISGEVTL